MDWRLNYVNTVALIVLVAVYIASSIFAEPQIYYAFKERDAVAIPGRLASSHKQAAAKAFFPEPIAFISREEG